MQKRFLIVILAMVCALRVLAQTGGVVLSEMLVDPKPAVALPEVEYVELFNGSTDTVSLAGWTLRVGTKTGRISSGIVPPMGYVVLCSRTVTEQFDSLLNVVGVTAWAALNNDAATVTLYDDLARPVSWFSYNISQFPDKEKSQGGWALECIDTQNLSGDADNWAFSLDPSGGTPGRTNSVTALHPDTLTPKVVGWGIPDDTTLVLLFNKSLHPLRSLKTDCFQLFGHTIDTLVSTPPFSNVSLTVSPNFVPDEMTNLFVNNIQCISGMYMADTLLSMLVPQALSEHAVVVNEVMYEVREQPEWIELYNRSKHAVSLGHLYLSVRGSDGEIKLKQPLSSDHLVLLPETFAVVARDFAFLNNRLSRLHDAILLNYNLPALPDVGACVVLTDSAKNVIDEVCYDPQWHHPLLEETHDISLERVSPDLEGNDAANWHTASLATGGSTPGERNSQYEDVANNPTDDSFGFSLEYDTFSPDADGYRDELLIHYNMPDHGFVLNADIFSPEGHFLAPWIRNSALGTEGTLNWNGKDSNGTVFRTGVYVIVCEVISTSGKHRTFRLTCVIATK